VSDVQRGTDSPGDPARVLFGRRLRELRERAGIRQGDLAARAGVSGPYLSSIEYGRGNPTLDVIVSLAKTLGVPVGRLFGDDDFSHT
jgi:transcriptional regulator with XRE-family HTH domain